MKMESFDKIFDVDVRRKLVHEYPIKGIQTESDFLDLFMKAFTNTNVEMKIVKKTSIIHPEDSEKPELITESGIGIKLKKYNYSTVFETYYSKLALEKQIKRFDIKCNMPTENDIEELINIFISLF